LVGAVSRIVRIAVVNIKKVLTATRNVVGFSSGQARRAATEGHQVMAPLIIGKIQVAMRDLGKRGANDRQSNGGKENAWPNRLCKQRCHPVPGTETDPVMETGIAA